MPNPFRPIAILASAAGLALAPVVFAAAVQSSSTVVGLVMTLAAGEHLAYPQAASLILGANIGTTFGPLLASQVVTEDNVRGVLILAAVLQLAGLAVAAALHRIAGAARGG